MVVSQLHSTRDCKPCPLFLLFEFAQFILPYPIAERFLEQIRSVFAEK